MMTRLLFVVITTACLIFGTAPVEGAFYLTGAQLYQANADGSIVNLSSTYRYSTNTFDTASRLSITHEGTTMDQAISFLLVTGTHEFTFSTADDGGTVSRIGINLFFSDTDDILNNSFNPRSAPAPSSVAGDLTVFNEIGAGALDYKVAKSVNGDRVRVQNYYYLGDASEGGKPLASGVNSFELGGQLVSVTGFGVGLNSGKPFGSFTLSVTATPEPSTIGIGALAFCGVVHWVKKRRNKKAIGERTVS